MRALPFFMLLSRMACRPVSPMRELHQLTAPFHPDQLSFPFHSCARCITQPLLRRWKTMLPIHTSARDASEAGRVQQDRSALPIHTSARDASPSGQPALAPRCSPNPYFRARCICGEVIHTEGSWLPIHTSARDASLPRILEKLMRRSQSILPREMHHPREAGRRAGVDTPNPYFRARCI